LLEMPPVFVTAISHPAQLAPLRLLIQSLQSFGGSLSACPVWVYCADPQLCSSASFPPPQVEYILLEIPTCVKAYPFGNKVAACAAAESLAGPETNALIWIDPDCLVIQPPQLFDLEPGIEAAFRPVHIGNVGLPASEPLDPFWQGIYAAVGVSDLSSTVTSFVDNQILRPYFNTHAFSINPALGLLTRWYALFQHLIAHQPFQQTACADERHQIFLFQALLSALVAASLAPDQIRILPPTYNYPYNLHARVPVNLRPAALNHLVCLTYEGRTIHPGLVTDIQINLPLRAWLSERL